MNERALIKQTMEVIPKVLDAFGIEARLNWITTSRDGQRYLIAAVDEDHALVANRGGLTRFYNKRLTHDMETLLNGRRVVLGNHSGLRFVVPLTSAPQIPDSVALPDALERDTLPIGRDAKRQVHVRAGDYVSELVTGAQGSGKSTHLKALAVSALRQGWTLYLADARAHTFNPDTWNALTAAPVATSDEDMLAMAGLLNDELGQRETLYRSLARQTVLMPRDLDEYNREAALRGLDPLPYFMFIADEANSFLENEAVARAFEDILRHGRKWGLLVAVGAHSWRDKKISRSFSMLFHLRLCFRVDDDTSGMVALNSQIWGKRAMKINEKGRGLLALGGGTPQLIQTYFLDPDLERAMLMAAARGQRPGPALMQEELAAIELARAAGGKISLEVLMKGGIRERMARRIIATFARHGWARKDPLRNNAYFLTERAPAFIAG